MLTVSDGEFLLGLARKALEERLGVPGSSVLPGGGMGGDQRGGVFVTLLSGPEKLLRGCMGRMESDQPLEATVRKMAVIAGMDDPRFPPLRREELDSTTIKLSILSPMEKVLTPPEANIRIGQHGVMVQAGGRSGVFLPEVPVECGWDAVKMLEQLCERKMGLGRDAWKGQGAEIFVFTTQSFEEPGR